MQFWDVKYDAINSDFHGKKFTAKIKKLLPNKVRQQLKYVVVLTIYDYLKRIDLKICN